ncbi:MAG: amino acid permease [bacterium]|jgi:amino acid transporter|nr:amino acid permease [bacterium]
MKDKTYLLRSLRLFDVVAIIVGIIIGSSIFQTPGTIAGLLGSGSWILGIWLIGGLFSFIGALCYAELASAYPREGGDYYFLHHAYGSWAGFLYAWGRIWVIHSGNIAMMAWIAGTYGEKLLPFPHAATVYAVGTVIILTGLNCIGLKEGKWTQNILATTQIVGLAVMVLVALFLVSPEDFQPVEAAQTGFGFGQFFLAFIFVQITFGGWSDAAFVAAEVKQPERNIFRALMTGLAIVTAAYVLINAALLFALGAEGMAANSNIMALVMERGLGSFGTHFMSLVIVVCALGSVNGMILVGGRIYHPFGRDHALFHFLGQWNAKSSVPLAAFLMQGVVACALLFWGTFEQLVIFTSAAHWLFMAMVGISLFILRKREPQTERPFRVPLYPVLPLLYILTCGMLLYSSFNYATSITPYGAWIGFGLVLSGLPVYWLSRRMEKGEDQ